jgi:hypothetical protein
MRSFRFVLILLWLGVFFVTAGAARADHMSAPVGDVILTIKGQMTQTNTPDGAEFDLDMLQKIGTISFSTSTPWTKGLQDFTGVPLNQLLTHIGATPASLSVSAINEYQVVVPASDAIDGGPILAWQQNGKLLSVREKGPLWLVYPFDAKSAYRTEEIHSRAVWQVVQIDLLP